MEKQRGGMLSRCVVFRVVTGGGGDLTKTRPERLRPRNNDWRLYQTGAPALPPQPREPHGTVLRRSLSPSGQASSTPDAWMRSCCRRGVHFNPCMTDLVRRRQALMHQWHQSFKIPSGASLRVHQQSRADNASDSGLAGASRQSRPYLVLSFCRPHWTPSWPMGRPARTVATPAMTPQIKSQHGERWREDGETRREALPFKMESSALIPLFFS